MGEGIENRQYSWIHPQNGGNVIASIIFLEDVEYQFCPLILHGLHWLECLLPSRLPFFNFLSNFRSLTSQNSTSPRQSHRRHIRTISPFSRSICNRLGNFTLRFVRRISCGRNVLCGSMTSTCIGIFGADGYTLSWSCRLYSNCFLEESEKFKERSTEAVEPEYL